MHYIKLGPLTIFTKNHVTWNISSNKFENTSIRLSHFSINEKWYGLQLIPNTRHRIDLSNKLQIVCKCNVLPDLNKQLNEMYNYEFDKTKFIVDERYTYTDGHGNLYYGPIAKDEAVILKLRVS